MNLPLFSYSRNLFTAVRSLRMEAKSVMLSYYLYAEATAYVSSLPFTLLLCWLGGLPLWIGVIAPLAPIGMKALVAAFIISHFNRTGVFIPPTKLFGKATTPLSMVLLLAGYVSSIAGFALPLIICVSFMLFITVAGAAVFAIPLRLSPAKFQRLAKEFMTSARADLSATQSSVAQASKSHAAITSLNTSQVGKGRISQLQGLAYLNALFMQRHRKILWRSALRFTAASAAIMVGLIVLAVIFPEPFNDIDYAFSSIAFIMYFVNRGTGFTQALFMNCDHALLTYPFVKKSGMILHLFVLRLRDIVLVNLPTALVIGFGFAVLLGLGNPARPLFDYAIAFFATLLFSIFFSVHYMAMYYLIQPYNAASEQKSALYGIVQAVTYFACWGLIQVHLPLVFLGTLSLGFCAIYCVVAGVLIYRYAPQTFRIKA